MRDLTYAWDLHPIEFGDPATTMQAVEQRFAKATSSTLAATRAKLAEHEAFLSESEGQVQTLVEENAALTHHKEQLSHVNHEHDTELRELTNLLDDMKLKEQVLPETLDTLGTKLRAESEQLSQNEMDLENLLDSRRQNIQRLSHAAKLFETHLGLKFEQDGQPNWLRLVFSQISQDQPERTCSFVMEVIDKDGCTSYAVHNTEPELDSACIQNEVNALNQDTSQVFRLVRNLRTMFVAACK